MPGRQAEFSVQLNKNSASGYFRNGMEVPAIAKQRLFSVLPARNGVELAALRRPALMAGVGEAPRWNSRSVLVLQGLKKGVGVWPSPAALVALTLAASADIISLFIVFFF